MPPWLTIVTASVVFLAVGFLLTWAIREGGSFAFLHPARWRRSTTDPPPRRFRRWWPSRYTPLGGELDRSIGSVALLVDDPPAFRAKAKEVAEQFGPAAIPRLRRRFHRPTEAPPGFTRQERGLTAWLSYWQFAIFEIVYHFRGQALPMLRKVAFGEYDWTQGNAIEVMCRLAAEGIERARTLADLKREMPGMRDEALDYAAGPLLQLAESDPNIAAVIAELRQVEEFERALQEIGETPGA